MKYSDIIKENAFQSLSDYDEEVIVDIIAKECSETMDAFLEDGARFYRGVSHSSDAFVKWTRSDNVRPPANFGFNYYQDLIDHLPSWQSWDDRSMSIVGSSSSSYAGSFAVSNNETFVVLPVNGAKISMVPANDFWNVRTGVTDEEVIGDGELDLSSYIYSLYYRYIELPTEEAKNFDTESEERGPDELMYYLAQAGIVDQVDNVMDPVRLGFKVFDTKSWDQAEYGKELWTSDTCYGINMDAWKRVQWRYVQKRAKGEI